MMFNKDRIKVKGITYIKEYPFLWPLVDATYWREEDDGTLTRISAHFYKEQVELKFRITTGISDEDIQKIVDKVESDMTKRSDK